MPSPLSEQDVYLFNEGTHHRLHQVLGSHLGTGPGDADGAETGGCWFAVWAPNAAAVSLIGDWNDWEKGLEPLAARGDSGIWEGFVPGIEAGAHYKFHIVSRTDDYKADKADPLAVYAEVAPGQASIVWSLDYQWNDDAWMRERARLQERDRPISIYEVHLGSWRRVVEEGNRSLTYRELAPLLVEHVRTLGFTHVELLPVMEHPYYGSWGYQVTGFFAATSRYGTPQDLMYLVDTLHQAGIGVLLDWVPSHFPVDEHGLGYFDGTHLYEHADQRKGFHPDWKSYIFNYGRHEVRSFLISSAAFWLEHFHADGVRVDAVASMLYLDYSREPGEWIPNAYGGRENLEAIAFLRALNEEMRKNFPGTLSTAEESTTWPMVSRPVYVGGLGFHYKWDMGWMHDTLDYLSYDPIHRRFHHPRITFRPMYAFTESFILPLSHDEVVHGKGSLLRKMPGDDWQRRANLRLLFGSLYAQPGKKLLFMGGEFGQWKEWNHDASLEWHLLENEGNAGLMRWLGDLNGAYRHLSALHQLDSDPKGFQWIDGTDADFSVIAFLRCGKAVQDYLLVVFNLTPVVRYGYRLGVPLPGPWSEVLNSDAERYGGSGLGNPDGVEAEPIAMHGRRHSIALTLPPLAVVVLRGEPWWKGKGELGSPA